MTLQSRLEPYITLLNDGKVVAFPTETVYGLGARIDRMEALDRIYELKGRPSDNPLIVHISGLDQLKRLTPWWNHPMVLRLAQAFWPGPLAIIVPRVPLVADRITGGLDTVAIRMPNHPLALALIEACGPLAAPSANRSGRPSPTCADHVGQDFGSQVPVLDGGSCTIGLESTVLDLTVDPPCILRPGNITASQLEAVIGISVINASESTSTKSPGTKYRHYAPRTPVVLIEAGDDISDAFEEEVMIIDPEHHLTGSSRWAYHYGGNYDRLARELYDRLRQADLEGLKRVVLFPLKNVQHPMYSALQNRIQKILETEKKGPSI
jgi:L-threonylcarbamoyladenylate synthase